MTWTPFFAALRTGLVERANQARTAANRVPTATTNQQTRSAATQAPAASSSAATPKHVPKETPKNMQDYEFLTLDVSWKFVMISLLFEFEQVFDGRVLFG